MAIVYRELEYVFMLHFGQTKDLLLDRTIRVGDNKVKQSAAVVGYVELPDREAL